MARRNEFVIHLIFPHFDLQMDSTAAAWGCRCFRIQTWNGFEVKSVLILFIWKFGNTDTPLQKWPHKFEQVR